MNTIKRGDQVKVAIFNSDAQQVGAIFTREAHSVASAIDQAIAEAGFGVGRGEDYTYTVTNETDCTSGRYRINAGGHVTLLE